MIRRFLFGICSFLLGFSPIWGVKNLVVVLEDFDPQAGTFSLMDVKQNSATEFFQLLDNSFIEFSRSINQSLKADSVDSFIENLYNATGAEIIIHRDVQTKKWEVFHRKDGRIRTYRYTARSFDDTKGLYAWLYQLGGYDAYIDQVSGKELVLTVVGKAVQPGQQVFVYKDSQRELILDSDKRVDAGALIEITKVDGDKVFAKLVMGPSKNVEPGSKVRF